MNIDLLSNYDLIKFCKLLKIPLVDVVNKDLLNNMTPKIGCYIIIQILGILIHKRLTKILKRVNHKNVF